MESPRLLLVLAVASAALAGCLGGGKQAASPTPSETDPYALAEGVDNVLFGKVTSEDHSPLGNATVLVIGTDFNATTTTAGEYRFENLVPRDYLVSVTLEGYRAKTQRAIIEDGKIFELNFQLAEKPSILPFSEVQQFNGQVSCQFAYATNPENVQFQDCGAPDPNNKVSKEFSIGSSAPAQVVVEAFWTPNNEMSQKLRMQVESVGFGHQDIIFGSVSGDPGMKMPISQSLIQKYYPQGGTFRVSLSAAPSEGQEDSFMVGAAVQQKFEVFVTIFYVEVGPANYSVQPPG